LGLVEGEQTTAKAKADPYGMTNKNGNINGNSNSNINSNGNSNGNGNGNGDNMGRSIRQLPQRCTHLATSRPQIHSPVPFSASE
jgi:hypothetical protein